MSTSSHPAARNGALHPAAPSSPVLAPEDDSVPDAVLAKLAETVSQRDWELFRYVRKVERVELDDQCQPCDLRAPRLDLFDVTYFHCFGLLQLEADDGGRVWLCATKALSDFLDRKPGEKPKRRRRR